MVFQKAVDNLKDKSNDEKKAVASGIAIGVVFILLIGWGFMFVKKMQKGGQLNLGGGKQSEFDFESVKEAQKALKQDFQQSAEELRTIRDSAVSNQLQAEVKIGADDTSDIPFGEPESTDL